jgi:hypothetical protein
MITRWSIAHERLQQQLTVHTHRQPPPAPKKSALPENLKDGRRVRINGRTYGSITKACRRYKCSPRRIYDWIKSDRARFV